MSGFVLTLDTRAPQLTWGPVTDANSGETLRVEYLVDEPGVDRAELELRDGRVLPVTVLPAAFTVELPEDAVEGAATLRAWTRDEVWNEEQFSLAIAITGVPYEPPAAPPVGGLPHRVVPVLIEAAPSRCGARARYTTTAVLASRSRVRGRSRYASPGLKQALRIRRRVLVVTRPDELFVQVAGATRLRGHSTATASARDAVLKRPEGPGAEDELILLDLL